MAEGVEERKRFITTPQTDLPVIVGVQPRDAERNLEATRLADDDEGEDDLRMMMSSPKGDVLEAEKFYRTDPSAPDQREVSLSQKPLAADRKSVV